jgi:hypothetical protein
MLTFEPVTKEKKKIPETKFTYKVLKLSEVNFSPLNPTIRTRKNKLKRLITNIAKNGQNNPITVMRIKTAVDNKAGVVVNRIVDGHRRCAALHYLGHTEVHAIVLNNPKVNYDKAFTSLHADTVRINTVQECERWLKGAKSISQMTKGRIASLQKRLGKVRARMIIKRCVSLDKSPGTIAMAMRNYEQYIGKKLSRKENFNVAYWLVNIGSSWVISTAIGALIPIDFLEDCINNKKEIPVDWAHKIYMNGKEV